MRTSPALAPIRLSLILFVALAVLLPIDLSPRVSANPAPTSLSPLPLELDSLRIKPLLNSVLERLLSFGAAWLPKPVAPVAPSAPVLVYTVNSLGDAGTGSGTTGDLRYCLTQANAAGGANTINFGVTGTITLGSELPISSSVTMQGPGVSQLTISGNNAVRVFNIASGSFEVTFADLTIANGLAPVSFSSAQGGGILNNSTGTLNLTNCTLSGNTAAVSGANTSNLASGGGLYNASTGNVNVINSLLSGNTVSATNAVTNNFSRGGGIYNAGAGAVTLTNSTLSNNSVFASGAATGNNSFGGGLYNHDTGAVNVINSTLANNAATSGGAVTSNQSNGGGLYNFGTGTVTVTGSTLSMNSATANGGGNNGNNGTGGGIYNGSTGILKVTGSTLAYNSASASGNTVTSNGGLGGGIYCGTGTVYVTNSTLASNTASASGTPATTNAGRGGGIYNPGGTLTVTNGTFSGNAASASGSNPARQGGGLFSIGGTANVKNTIVAGNTANTNPDVFGTFTSQGYNLIGDNTGSSSFTNGVNNDQVGSAGSPLDPLLGPLQNNGGPTQTMALLNASPAIDKGAAATDPATGNLLTTDQLGTLRPADQPGVAPALGGDNSDIGAFEIPPSNCPPNLTVNHTGDGADVAPGNGVCATSGGVCTLRAAIEEANALTLCATQTINFSVTGTITLSSPLPTITHDLTINGPGPKANNLVIEGNNTFLLMKADGAGVDLTINLLSFTKGRPNDSSAGALEFINSNVLNVTDSEFYGNQGVSANGEFVINAANSTGVTLNRCTVRNNATSGIRNDLAPLTVTSSTFSDNNGTAIYNISTGTSVSYSTITNHLVGIWNDASVQAISATIKNNLLSSNGNLNLRKTGAFSNTLSSQGYNLIDDDKGNVFLDTSGPGDLLNVASAQPTLAAVGDYGGATQTRALLPGSQALNAGTNTGAPATDQRGIARPQQSTTDIGAFESQGFTLALGSGNNQSTAINTNFALPLSVIVTANGASEPVNGGQVSFTSPGSGASATIADNPATISSGTATSGTVTANGTTGGPYTVTASATGADTPVNFSLTNTGTATVTAINRASANPACASSSVNWTVTFSDSITGLTASNFNLVGGTGASLSNVTGSGTSWTVTANAGTAAATLGLNMVNASGLSSTITNLPFTGQTYTVSGLPTTSDAGMDQTLCTTTPAALAANAPSVGTGAWSVVSGPSTSTTQFSSTSNRLATFTPAGGAGTYTLRWTISNAPCTASTDDVVLTYNAPTTLGTYANANVALGGNTTLTPAAAPTGTTSLNVSAPASFNGTLAADPVTGVITVTNAQPAGTYTLTVTAFGVGCSASRTLTLTVNQPATCAKFAFRGQTPGLDYFTFPTGIKPYGIAVGDFNGDGQQDLATANNGGTGDVSVLLGNGSGSFSAASGSPIAIGSSPEAVAVGDFNGDGRPDLTVGYVNGVAVLLGNGSGGFSAASGSPYLVSEIGGRIVAVNVGDFNGDGRPDIAAANYVGNVRAWLGNGSGGFSAASGSPFTVGANPVALTLGDFNNDGKLDLVTANNGSNNVTLLLGDGSGGFSAASGSPFAVGTQPSSVVLGDFNNDGKPDLAVANSGFFSQFVTILLGNGSGGFSASNSPSLQSRPDALAVGDFNGDGRLDIVTTYYQFSGGDILLGNGSGAFTLATSGIFPPSVRFFNTASSTATVTVGDFNGDGRLDLVTGSETGQEIYVSLNNCAPTVVAATGLTRQRASAGTTDTIATINDLETAAGSLTFAVSPPSGISISGITNSNGTISATIAADCAAAVGDNTVGLTVTDAHGATGTANLTINVTDAATPTTAMAGPNQTLCGTGPATLAANTPIVGTGTWQVVGGPSFLASQFSNVNDPHATFTPAGGTGTYTLWWTIAGVCASSFDDVALTFSAQPTITLGASPSVFPGTTSANLPYTATTGSPNQYSLDYDAAANSAGFVDVTNATLTASPIALTVPGAAASATYNATLTVRNSATGCVSNSVSFTVTISACPTQFTVNDLGDAADATPGDTVCATSGGVCTLRAAIQEANARPACAPLTINFSVTGTINLTGALPNLNHPNLTINGPGATLLTVRRDTGGAYRIFTLNAGRTATINGLTITNGFIADQGGGLSNDGGTLTINDCVITGNTAWFGGGVRNTGGTLTINRSAIVNNFVNIASTKQGGGIYGIGGSLTLNACTISGNQSSPAGVFVQGGGVGLQSSNATLTNCTISNNPLGDALTAASASANTTVTLTNCTLNGTPAANIWTLRASGSGGFTTTLQLKNTLVTSDGTRPNVEIGTGGTLVSLGHNLISDNSSGLTGGVNGDLVNTNPLLATLGNYGGATQTHALLPGSSAINAGTSTGAPTTDQRNNARVGAVDIGAFESQGFTLAVNSGNNQSTLINTAFANPLAVLVTALGAGEPVDGGLVTFTPPGSGASATVAGSPATINSSVATTGMLTANGINGAYNVAASASGATSINFALTNACDMPVISMPPQSVTVCPTAPVTFSVAASGTDLTYQWRKGGNPLNGATGSSFSLPATAASDAGSYDVIVTGACGTLTSTPALLVVNAVTAITAPPTSQTKLTGESVTFSVVATGTNLGYQWRKNGNPIGGANGSSLTLNGLLLADAGSYDVIVSGTCGTQTSAAATLLVNCPGLTVNPALLPNAPMGASYNQTISATGGSAPYTFAVTGGALPGGLMLSPQGQLTGTLNVGGSFNFTISAMDGAGCVSSRAYTIATNAPPTLAPVPLSRAAGSSGAAFTIANVSDAETAANQLQFMLSSDGTNFGSSATLNGVTVTLSGIMPNGQVNAQVTTTCAASTAAFTLKVTDAAGVSSTAPWTVTVPVNPAPVLSYSAQSVALGQTLTINPASGPSDNGTLASLVLHSITPALSGVSVNSNNGVVTISNAAAVGSYVAVIRATDNCGRQTDANLSFNVTCPTLSISPATLPNGVQGTSYQQTLTATPNGTTYSFAVTTGALPPGLSLNSATGALTGTPTAPGNYTFGITATGWGSCSKSQSYNLLITGTCTPLTLAPSTLPAATLGTAYNQTITATGGVAPYSYSISSGALPAGLSLSSGGALTGTPTAAGTFAFTLKATGQGGCFSTRAYVLTVTCTTLTFNPATLPTGTTNQPYSQTLTITPVGTYTFSLLLGSLPPGFTLNGAGVLSGITNQTGTYNFTVKVVGGACQATKAYTLIISASAAVLAQMADYDGDGQGDFALWANDGNWRLLLSQSGLQRQAQAQTWGQANDVSLLGDYDGDGRTDFAVFRPANGTWYVKQSSNDTALVKAWGSAGDVPVPGDYDGDGKTDLAVFRPSEGNWYVLRSSDQQYTVTAWGAGYAPYNDVAVPSDYDGDGRTDLAVFRRSTGQWFIQHSKDGQSTVKLWGVGTDVTVPADYDGDGQTDLAVWRQGAWYIWQSATDERRVEHWGTSAAPYYDQAVPSDYDGDGRAEIAVWRAGDLSWHVKHTDKSLALPQAQGQISDVPVAVKR